MVTLRALQNRCQTRREDVKACCQFNHKDIKPMEDRKMQEYLAIITARTEHVHRNQSITPVRDFDGSWHREAPSLLRKFGQALCVLGTGLAAVGERLRNERGIVVETPFTAQEHGEALN
jgi:hypothetical protein